MDQFFLCIIVDYVAVVFVSWHVAFAKNHSRRKFFFHFHFIRFFWSNSLSLLLLSPPLLLLLFLIRLCFNAPASHTLFEVYFVRNKSEENEMENLLKTENKRNWKYFVATISNIESLVFAATIKWVYVVGILFLIISCTRSIFYPLANTLYSFIAIMFLSISIEKKMVHSFLTLRLFHSIFVSSTIDFVFGELILCTSVCASKSY